MTIACRTVALLGAVPIYPPLSEFEAPNFEKI